MGRRRDSLKNRLKLNLVVDFWCYLSHNPKLFSNSQGQVERNATQELVKGDWKLFFDKLIKI